MKNFVITVVAAAFAALCPELRSENIISGQIEGLTSKDKIYAAVFDKKGLPQAVDSTNVDDKGRFTLKTRLADTEALIVALPAQDKLAMGKNAFRGRLFSIFLEGDGNVYNMKVSGGKTVITGGIYNVKAFSKIKYLTENKAPFEDIERAREDFFRANPYKYAYSAYVLKHMVQDGKMNVREGTDAYENLDSRIKLSPYGQEVFRILNFIRISSVGAKAPDFTLADKDKRDITLSDYRGKYVILVFWGSWCGASRAANPVLAQFYKEHNGKGFEMISLAAREQSEQAWMEAIKKDCLTWPQINTTSQVFDEDQVEITDAYNINYYPQCVLIDPKGIIIARGTVKNVLEKAGEIIK